MVILVSKKKIIVTVILVSIFISALFLYKPYLRKYEYPLDAVEELLGKVQVIENGKVGDVLTLTICRVDANYNISTFDVTVKLVEDSMTSVQEEEPTDNGFYFPFGN